jgi:MFS family permease
VSAAPPSSPGDPSARAQQALIALVQVLGLTAWFSATAVAPALRQVWGISDSGAVWLTATVQLGFVAGALVSTALNLADRFRPQRLLAASALGAALCTAALAGFAQGLAAAVVLRTLTGVFLAGVYPVGMKLMASWSPSAGRGRSFGILIGALTLGSAVPHLIRGLGDLPWQAVLYTAAGLTAAGALLAVATLRPGPHGGFGRFQPNPRYALSMFTARGPRLANLGYFGHMWELYAWWTWLPAFLLASQAARGVDLGRGANLVTFLAVGIAGVVGCLVGGWVSDRYGRPVAGAGAMAVSGSCCLASPLFFTAPPAVLLVFLLLWGASVIADSGVFSTSLSETADRRYVGSALTAQTAFGFLLTVVTIQLVPLAAALVGWRYAFLILLPGPYLGAVAMRALGRPAPSPRR